MLFDAPKQMHHSTGKELTDQVQSLFLGTGFLNLHWLTQALDVLLALHTRLHHHLLHSKPLDRASVSVLMEDTAILLEACNLIKRSMSFAAQCKLHVKYAIGRLSGCKFDDQMELLKVRQVLRECLRELESGSKVQHTGSWLVLEDDASSYSKGLKTKKVAGKSRIQSKATTDANLVSLVVFTALAAAFNAGGYVDHARLAGVASQQGLGCVWKLERSIREEAAAGPERKTAPVLESLRASLTQMALLTDSWVESPEKTATPGEMMQQLVKNAGKKLEYFESSLEILEKQVEELFVKLLAHRKVVLSG